MAFLVQRFDLSDKSNLRVRQKLNAVVDAVNYLLRGGGGELGTVVYGTAMDDSSATILVNGDHTTVTEDPTGTWTVDHNGVALPDETQDTDYLSGLGKSGEQDSYLGGVEITLTGGKSTLQFDEFGHRAGTASAIPDPSVTFKIPEELDHLTDVDTTDAEDGYVLTFNGVSWVAAGAGTDEKVAIDGGTPDYLDNVLIAGNGVTLTTDGNTLVVAAEAEDPGANIDTLGSNSEGSESEATDTWTANGTDGLALWQTVRVVYNHSGDQKLYEFRRKLTFDRWGRLYSVSGETRIEVDAPGAC